MAKRILTENFVRRLAQANAVCRMLRRHGLRVIKCTVIPGDALAKSAIVVAGGGTHLRPEIDGCIVTRRVGEAS